VYYINEDNLTGCPYVRTEINREQVIAVVESGAEIYLLSEKLFNRLLDRGLLAPHIPVVNGTLVSAWGV
jgi:hypothetical protein